MNQNSFHSAPIDPGAPSKHHSQKFQSLPVLSRPVLSCPVLSVPNFKIQPRPFISCARVSSYSSSKKRVNEYVCASENLQKPNVGSWQPVQNKYISTVVAVGVLRKIVSIPATDSYLPPLTPIPPPPFPLVLGNELLFTDGVDVPTLPELT